MDEISNAVSEKLRSIEGEAAVLGSTMIDPDAIGLVRGILTAESFFRPEHQLIFEAIETLDDKKAPVDAVAVRTVLKESGKLRQLGETEAEAVEYLGAILDSTPSSANATYYAGVVKDRQKYRQVVKAVESMKNALGEPVGVDQLVEKVQGIAFDEIEREQTGNDRYDVASYATRIATDMQDRREVIETGFRDLDAKIGGMRRGELIIVAGRPSMGKTSLSTDFALNAARAGKKVLYFSLETSAKGLMERMECSMSRVSLSDMRTGKASQAEEARVYEASLELEKMPVVVHEGAETPEKLASLIRSEAKRGRVDLVVIDYLQLMHSSRKSESRQQEITRISRLLKRAAIVENVSIIAASQLNREADNRTSHKPRLSDLRESGSIEQDADVVLLLYRDDYYRPDGEAKDSMAEVDVAKQRDGPTGPVKLVFFERYTTFANAAFIDD
jgi:replicative DNA helicase